jgi:hypothetical protein
VWAVVVVGLDEGIELGLKFGEGGGAGVAGEPFFEGLVESLDLAAGGGVVGAGVDLSDPEAVYFVFKAVASAFASGEPGGNTMPLSVNVEAGIPWAATVLRNSASTMGPVTRRWAVTESA